MIDIGLQSGVNTLWKQDMFVDYTIKVSGRKFNVHKLVLASVSDYFCTMLNGSMMESVKDEVEFTQFSAQLMSKLLNFIYTGYESLLIGNSKEFLECAVYFQMPKVIKVCTTKLIKGLTVANCLDLLATFVDYSLYDAAAQVRSFIKCNAAKVMNRFRTREMSEDVMQVLMKCWKKSDWEMFIYLTTWFSADFEKRTKHLNKLMGQVRFSQFSPREIEAVKDMDVYKNDDGTWKDQVCNAHQGRASYEDLPIYQKVVASPEQSSVRGTKTLYIMNTDSNSNGAVVVSTGSKNKCKWKSCWKSKQLEVSGSIPFVLEVNNFLITCSEFGENQTWQIFDPRTFMWSKIANMPTPRDEFAMVCHDKQLYVLGGTVMSANNGKVITDTVLIYSFETNSWSTSKIKLPVRVKNHAACVMNGAIYVSGGEIADNTNTILSDRLDRLDISSRCWETKAPMASPRSHHPMFAMKVPKGGEGIFILIEDDKKTFLSHYNPLTDEWSHWGEHDSTNYPSDNDRGFRYLDYIHWVPNKSRLLVNGNFVYLTNLNAKEDICTDDDITIEEYVDRYGICERWKVKCEGYEEIEKYQLADFPSFTTSVACLLAVPKHVK